MESILASSVYYDEVYIDITKLTLQMQSRIIT